MSEGTSRPPGLRRWTGALLSSVRARITFAACLVVGVALVAGSVALLVALRHGLVSSQDDVSRARATDLADQVDSGTLSPRIDDIGDDGVAQVVSASGKVLAASSGLGDSGPISTTAPPLGEFEQLDLHDVPDDSETEDYRVWALTTTGSDGPVRIYVGNSLESASEAVATVRNSLYVGVPVLLALVAVTTWVLVGRALRPVEDIRSEVARISDRRLDRRVPVPSGDDEIAHLAVTMNEMLDRLEASAARQRDFVADASHELQSPLAALRTELEVALAHPDGVDWNQFARNLLVDGDRMERLVHDLLFLARQDAASANGAAELIDLDTLVLEEVARLGLSSSVEADVTRVTPAPVTGQAEDLRRLVRNLVENAARHAEARIEVSIETEPGRTLLRVEDDGMGIPEADRERIFERFVRLDSARSPGGGGTGLGLAIARAIARRHGGDIVVEARADPRPGASFVLRLPSDASAPLPAERANAGG
jgi:signal transduction histidine kinase